MALGHKRGAGRMAWTAKHEINPLAHVHVITHGTIAITSP